MTKQDIITLLQIFGGATVVLTAFIGIIAKVFFEKIKNSIEHSYNSKIEVFKNSLLNESKLLESVQSTFLNNTKEISVKKIQALEAIWKNTLLVRRGIPAEIFMVMMILADEEFNIEELKKMQVLGEKNTYEKIKKLFTDKNSMVFDLGGNAFNELEDNRCFVSENLYSLFRVYNAFIGRNVHFIAWGTHTDQLKLWKKDEHSIGLLSSVLSKEEIEFIMKHTFGSLHKVIELLEYKILNMIRQELLGTNESIDSIKYLMQIEKEIKTQKKGEFK